MPTSTPVLLVSVCLAIVSSAGFAQQRQVQPVAAQRRLSERNEYREAALDAARWIRSAVVQSENGAAWPAVPRDLKTISPNLYQGVSGIVLFFLEAHQSTQDESFLKDARRGADYLLKSIDEQTQSGLYDGLARIGFALQETFKATRQAAYGDGAKRCVQLLKKRAKETGQGVEWNSVMDVISGTAGIGLFLLYAGREQHDDVARDLAVAAGKRLIELGRPALGGLKWAMTPQLERTMPNFSHGTAGWIWVLARSTAPFRVDKTRSTGNFRCDFQVPFAVASVNTAGNPDTGQLLDAAAIGDASARQRLLNLHRDRLLRLVAVHLDARVARRVIP
jgi:hypothetical protein